jgi:hypothetical protein
MDGMMAHERVKFGNEAGAREEGARLGDVRGAQLLHFAGLDFCFTGSIQ